jgi:hypothetical protein
VEAALEPGKGRRGAWRGAVEDGGALPFIGARGGEEAGGESGGSDGIGTPFNGGFYRRGWDTVAE